ncbi:MAG: tyrosine-type recombinase/integrase [Candidatus Cloacimonetes bacterium]|nr:tyrosine-type recombinase/integrase [Candidatus Cloacimonadota bacterium]
MNTDLTIQQPISKSRFLATVPQETVWLSNFISPHTKKTYLQAVRDFIGFNEIESAEKLKEVDQAHVIAWRDSLIEQGASERTVNARISAISSLFKHLCEKQIAKRNPTIGVRRPKVETKEVKSPIITPNQVRQILNATSPDTLKGLRDSAILHILFYTGCRISEVGKLKVKDYYEDGGYCVLHFTIKGGKKNKIAIHQELQIVLRRYLSASGHGSESDSPLILAVKRAGLRRHLKKNQLANIFNKYAQQVGLPRGVYPHSARATFITQALENGAKIEAVRRSVGHSKINTTQMYDKRLVRHRESASFAVRW